MKVYSPSEIAELLDIKQATLRKYSIMLEEHGYKISRNSQNHRYYKDEDVITLRRVIDGKNSGVTLEEAIKNVVSIDQNNTYTNEINNGITTNDSDITELKKIIQKQTELIQNQTEFMKELSRQLKEQQEYIDNRLNERDKNLLTALEEKLEAQKQIAAAEEKKGLFSKLFKK